MDTESGGLGLTVEKELTCSICTEILYDPLTLLDCLHFFCGSCLKEWFNWQLVSSRNIPSPSPRGATPYTCPSCRAPVRDTKHNAAITTLLEMFLGANPAKSRKVEEQQELRKKYRPGDNILPKVEGERSLRERLVDDEDRRILNEVRDLSLREVGLDASEARELRRRDERRYHGSRLSRSRDTSGDGRNTEEIDRERHRRREMHNERHTRGGRVVQPGGEEYRSRRSNEEASTSRHDDSHHAAARQIEHQSSIRSLISSSDVDPKDMEEEILRQIREEGLLDGIDLENLDVNQEDQISERIAEAFRRRQGERARQDSARRSDTSTRRRATTLLSSESIETSDDESSRNATRRRRRRSHSRTPSSISQNGPPSRPPQSMSAVHAAHLDIDSSDEGRQRRRYLSSTISSATDPVPASNRGARSASRSASDSCDRPHSSHLPAARSPVSETWNGATNSGNPLVVETSMSGQRSRQLRANPMLRPRSSSAARVEDTCTARRTRPEAPHDALVMVDRSLVPAPLSQNHRHSSLVDRANALSSGSHPSWSPSTTSRNRMPLFSEPLINCARCAKPHIEYELHYNCGRCAGGHYNICLCCYRAGRGCLHWFGFGRSAWTKWEIQKQSGDGLLEKPHKLTPSRYVQPRRTAGGADGRRTLTTSDPLKRLQSGTFCDHCYAWANECYWRCDFCNEGEWGFCNLCVNQGKSCTHPLLPLTYKAAETGTPPRSPIQNQKTPITASILTGPGVMDVGPFKPLTFSTKCDVCRYPIQPSQTRYHCFSCTSQVSKTLAGDYDICITCYPKLVASRRISVENGPSGWRRCLEGHRMVVVGFDDNQGGQRRVLVQDLVGGRDLRVKPYTQTTTTTTSTSVIASADVAALPLEIWSWGDGTHVRGDDTHVKLITTDVAQSAPATAPGLALDPNFPPDGGVGMKALAAWSWYPGSGDDDELLFPKGAEITECKDVNGDWFHGSYMGKRGLFPSNYVRVLD